MARGRCYRIPFTDISVSAAQDLFEVISDSTKVTRIKELHLSQSSDPGEAAEELLRIQLKSGSTIGGSGGSSVTPTPLHLGDPAFAGTAARNNTTQATHSFGSFDIHEAFTFNTRMGLVRVFTPQTWITIPPSQAFLVDLIAAPADALTMSGVLVVEELG